MDDGRTITLPLKRVIAYFDVDCFYAQCEQLRAGPRLAGKAVGVTQKFLVVTCNYAARAIGVRGDRGRQEGDRGDSTVRSCRVLPFRSSGNGRAAWTAGRRGREEDAVAPRLPSATAPGAKRKMEMSLADPGTGPAPGA